MQAKRSAKKNVQGNANAWAYLTALVLGIGASDAEAREGAEDALRAGVRPPHAPTPALRELFQRVVEGVSGEQLRGWALSEGQAIAGYVEVANDDAYKFRSRSCPGNWARSILAEHQHRTVARMLERFLEAGPGAEVPDLSVVGGGGVGSPDLFSAAECFDALKRELDSLENLRKSGQVLATGYVGLDALLDSLLPGDVTVVAARTSVGKTKFALNVVDACAERGHPAHVYSLEMGRARVLGRLWSIDCGAPTPTTPHQLAGAAYAYNKPVWICDTAGLSAGDILSRIRLSSPRPKLVVVDYLGLLDHGDIEKVTEASAIGRSVKALRGGGRELGYHLLLPCQINRAGAGPDGPPQLHHLRGSGDIEQDADHILMLGKGESGRLIVDVVKNRNTGRTGKVYLRTLGDSCRMVEG